jgi:hypothetical protein
MNWNASERIEFDFYDVHESRPLTDRARISLTSDSANGF